MKKKLLILVCLTMLSLGLAACVDDTPSSTPEPSVPTHTHTWESAWEHDDSNHWHGCKDATCNEVDSKAAHTWDEGTVTKEPTETEVGEKTYGCTVCDATKTEEIAKVGHTHVKSETWSTDGTNHWKTCTGCDEKLDLVAHSGGSATCEAAAECEVCGVAYGEALGHTEVVDAAVAPTCTEAGKTEGKHCSVCNEVIVAQEEVAALGHTEVVDAAVAPTCTEKGKTEGKHCSVCNEVLVAQEEVAALGHTEVVDAAVAATCTEKGKTEGKHCSVCNEVLVAQEEVAALGHTEVVDAAVAPTHTEAGKTEGKHCSVCNEVLVAQEEVAALGHHFVDGKCDCGEQYVEEATGEWTLVTELKDGEQVLIGAPAYGKLLSTVKVATHYNKGVDYAVDNFANVTDNEIFVVTANEDGTYTFTSLSGKVIAMAASYSSLNDTGANKSWALEAKDGSEGIFYVKNTGRKTYLEWYASKNNWSTYTAKNTAEYEISFYAKATVTGGEHVHNYISEAHEATCTEDGYTTFTCKCGENYKEEGAKATGHTEVADAAVAPTCEEKGKTAGTHCSVCNEVIVAQEEVAALGHTEVVDAAVAATCTEAGKTEGKHCSVCNEVLVAQEEVAALGHTEVVDAAVAATCTEAGKTEGKHCSVCNEVLVAQEEVAALGHTEVVDAAVAATCTEAGKTEGKHCSVCEEVLVAQEEVAALGHQYGDWNVSKPATFEETGMFVRSCECGASEEKPIPALVAATEVSIENDINKVSTDSTIILSLLVNPVDADSYKVEWTSNNESLVEFAYVDGVYKAIIKALPADKKSEKVTITVTLSNVVGDDVYSSVTSSFEITVVKPIVEYTFDNGQIVNTGSNQEVNGRITTIDSSTGKVIDVENPTIEYAVGADGTENSALKLDNKKVGKNHFTISGVDLGTNDFTITVKININKLTSKTDSSNYLFGIGNIKDAAEGYFNVAYKKNGNYNQIKLRVNGATNWVGYGPVGSYAEFRIVREGNTVTFYISPDGKTNAIKVTTVELNSAESLALSNYDIGFSSNEGCQDPGNYTSYYDDIRIYDCAMYLGE